MKNREASSYIEAHIILQEFYRSLRLQPTIVRLDNESSDKLEQYLRENNLEIQFVPPNNHRANKAERAIRDFKNHFIASLSTTNENFPMNLWDELLPQIEITINLLRPFGPDKSISAYHGINGKVFDFLRHPIAPFGTLVMIHNSPQNRES